MPRGIVNMHGASMPSTTPTRAGKTTCAGPQNGTQDNTEQLARGSYGAGGPLNWNPALGNRPSLSSLAGGLGMNRAIRQGFLNAGSQVVLLPEEYTGANIFYRVADLTYDAQFYFLMVDLQARNATPEEWALAFQRFLHNQQLTLPPGALKMRWISNHDTVSWTFQKQRPLRLYGVERMRALLAICALIEGVPMLYQGDEDPAVYGGQGPSSVDFLAGSMPCGRICPPFGKALRTMPAYGLRPVSSPACDVPPTRSP